MVTYRSSTFLQSDSDKDHQVRVAMGNGIRPDTWADFLNRFGDIRICECYGATEGNIGFVNYIGKIGAIGKEHFLQKVTCENICWLAAFANSFQ